MTARPGRAQTSLITERERERERERWCVDCVGAGEVWAEVRWPVRRGEESATRPPGLDQCLVSPGPVSRHCPGSATLSALSRRHSADRRGDDTVGTVTTQLELSSSTTTTQPRLGQHLHHHLSSQPGHNMELLLRQNSFDIHNKPPAAGGLFDREYPHPHYSQPAFRIFLSAAAGSW